MKHCRAELSKGPPKRLMNEGQTPPILFHKHYDQESVFTPENLLREARRQKSLTAENVPTVCVLDPDGDILHNLIEDGRATPYPRWACYHTKLYDFDEGGIRFGIVAHVVGASFAVLVAEELFAAGCELLINVTSAGQITRLQPPPYFVLIERALRDEGTSYHYLPPSTYSEIDKQNLDVFVGAFADFMPPVHRGATWTTDAPFRETPEAIDYARSENILAVEMEAAALYAFSQARGKPVVCFAHVTNLMASIEGDFEKGAAGGSYDALRVIGIAAQAWLNKGRA